MTKVTHFLETHQIDDVQWKDKFLYVYYSDPGCTVAGEHQFFQIKLDKFYQWLEDSNNLDIETPKPSLTDTGDWEEDTYVASVMPEDFHKLENSHTWPIIRQYLLIHYPELKEFDGVTAALDLIMPYFKPKP